MLWHGRILFRTHSLAPMDPMFPRAIGSAYRRGQSCGIRPTIHPRRLLTPSVSPPTWPPRARRTRRPMPLIPRTRTHPTNSCCGASVNVSGQSLPHRLAKRLLFTSHVPPKALQSIPHSTQNWFNLRETSTGRFYASIVLKLVVVEILLNYDLKLAHENGVAKKETFFTFDSFRIPRACIMMRRKSYNGDVVGDNAWEGKLGRGRFKTIVVVFLGGGVYYSNLIGFFFLRSINCVGFSV